MVHGAPLDALGCPICTTAVRIPAPTRAPVVAALVVEPWDGDREALLDAMVSDVASGIRVLRSRDGVWISEDQVMDRARNIVAGLAGNYHITARSDQ